MEILNSKLHIISLEGYECDVYENDEDDIYGND